MGKGTRKVIKKAGKKAVKKAVKKAAYKTTPPKAGKLLRKPVGKKAPIRTDSTGPRIAP